MAGRRPNPVVRAVNAVPWARLAGAAGLVLVSYALYWATTDRTFAVDPLKIPISGERYTDEARIRAAMALPDDKLVNIFRIPTGDLAKRIEDLPAIRSAQVVATLPHTVTVQVEERTPILVWRSGSEAWLVDADGHLFAPADAIDAAELGTGATGTALPAVDDRRIAAPLTPDATIPPLDLQVVRLLLTITPAMIRSSAPELHLSMDDSQGYVLEAPGQWRAIFGPYTPVLRPPSIIPAQVQCLDALIGDREAQVAEVTLAITDDVCGTYREHSGRKGTQARKDAASPAPGGRKGGPGATPKPTRRP
ncbi:MAG: FtsQ-type POTRA domain-containing protein [Chloroflexota bacterium]